MAASRRVSPAAARPSAARSAARAPGRRRRPSLWRRALLHLPQPPRLRRSREPGTDHLAALRDEVHELRLAVAALQAEVAQLHARPPVPVAPAFAEPVVAVRDAKTVTLLLPLARAAQAAGVPADGVVSVDLGRDTAATEIVLPSAADTPLPEASLLDPRAARVSEALDELMDAEAADRPVAAAHRDTA